MTKNDRNLLLKSFCVCIESNADAPLFRARSFLPLTYFLWNLMGISQNAQIAHNYLVRGSRTQWPVKQLGQSTLFSLCKLSWLKWSFPFKMTAATYGAFVAGSTIESYYVCFGIFSSLICGPLFLFVWFEAVGVSVEHCRVGKEAVPKVTPQDFVDSKPQSNK